MKPEPVKAPSYYRLIIFTLVYNHVLCGGEPLADFYRVWAKMECDVGSKVEVSGFSNDAERFPMLVSCRNDDIKSMQLEKLR